MLDVLWPQMSEGLKERWEWATDVIGANDGSEERTAIRTNPLRTFEVAYTLLDEGDLNFVRAMAFKQQGTTVKLPLMQRAVRITASATATALTFDNEYCDVRAGQEALVFDQNSYEKVTIDTVSATGCTLTTGLVSTWENAWFCPVTTLLPKSILTLKRASVDAVGDATITLVDEQPVDPVLSPYNADTFGTYSGKLVVDERPIGAEFDEQIMTGAMLSSFDNQFSIRSDWLRSKINTELTWQLDRTAAGIGKWLNLLDTVQGSETSFYIPSWRADFSVLTAPVPTGTTFVCSDDIYSSAYNGDFTSIFIETAGGTHYASISGVTTSGGQDTITFSPALPSGTGWSTTTKIGFLYRARIADDIAEFTHYDLLSFLTFKLMTTDE